MTEFNLAVRGDAADEYILDSVRTWPELWGNIKGVTGTLLLSNAFALGGEFEYQFRVDITSLGTLARIDETVKAGEGGWRKSREDWFRNRTAVRSHISRYEAGDKQYYQERKGTDGAVHAVISAASRDSKGFCEDSGCGARAAHSHHRADVTPGDALSRIGPGGMAADGQPRGA